ncbi:MAG: redoxin domain-containing protein [Armatimonadetes bacterium]|nr:redoxin domain-containing protein [Armatimonadota bacterium]
MGARRRWVGWLALLLGTLSPAAMAQMVATSGQEGLPAPAFTVAPVNGSSVSLRKLVSGTGGVVAFVDHRSRDGLRLVGYLQAQYKAWKEQKVGVLVLVNSATVRETVAKFVQDNSLTMPVGHDLGSQLSRQFGMSSLAMAMVINRDGVVVKRVDQTATSTDLGPQIGQAVNDLINPKDAEGAAGTGEGSGKPAAPGAAAAPGTAPATGTAPAAVVKPAVPTMSEAEARERIGKGLQLLQRGYSQAVLEEARLIVSRRPNDALALLWLAYALEATRSYPEAAVTYRELVRLVPGHAYAAAALQRIDPTGRWRTAADVPGALPPVSAPTAPTPPPAAGAPAPAAGAPAPPPAHAPDKDGAKAPATSGQGSSGIGE